MRRRRRQATRPRGGRSVPADDRRHRPRRIDRCMAQAATLIRPAIDRRPSPARRSRRGPFRIASHHPRHRPDHHLADPAGPTNRRRNRRPIRNLIATETTNRIQSRRDPPPLTPAPNRRRPGRDDRRSRNPDQPAVRRFLGRRRDAPQGHHRSPPRRPRPQESRNRRPP